MMPSWIARVVLLLIACGALVADARPGGGQSSSGGSRTSSSRSSSSSSSSRSSSSSSSSSSRSSSSSSRSSSTSSSYGGGGGGGGGGLIGVIVVVGLVVVIGGVIAAGSSSRRKQAWTSAPVPVHRPIDVSPITSHDPDFSRSVFEDFMFELYAIAQRTRGDPQPLGAYLSPTAVAQLGMRGPPPRQVVVGSLVIESVSYRASPEPRDHINVRIEATLLGDDSSLFVVENWRLSRSTRASSKPPTQTRTWPCPNCGAPWTGSLDRICAHCGQNVGGGRFDWVVDEIVVTSSSRALASLTGTVEEQGNDLPTVVDPRAQAHLAAITQGDPNVTFASLEPRVMLVYAQLNTAWNAGDLGPVRGFVTASLRNYLDYWLREYSRQGLKNKLDNAQISRIELAKVTRDKYYDAITVRIFAAGNDFTVNAANKVVGGSPLARRAYTEYWTFLRSSTRRGPVTTTATCPNCGAPISMSDRGECTYCNAAVESGNIDWTLSKIEQDDSYAG